MKPIGSTASLRPWGLNSKRFQTLSNELEVKKKINDKRGELSQIKMFNQNLSTT